MKMTKPSTKPKKTTRKRLTEDEVKVSPWLEDYLDCFSFTYKPVNEAFINRISSELITWARTDQKAFKIRPFFSDKGIAQDTYSNWRKKFKTFGTAYNLALAIIGDRREGGALERKLDSQMVSFMAHHYDPDWREAREFHNSLKKDAQAQSTGSINVYLEKFPSSDIVPQKVTQSADKLVKPSRSPEEVAKENSVRKKSY